MEVFVIISEGSKPFKAAGPERLIGKTEVTL